MIRYVARTHEVDRGEFERVLKTYDSGGDIMPVVADIYIEEGRILEKQGILTRQLSRKFGIDEFDKKIIREQMDPDKLDEALEAFVFAAGKEEVLRCLR